MLTKILLTISLSLTVTTLTLSQRLWIGLEAGANVATLQTPTHGAPGITDWVGTTFGIPIEYQCSDYFSLQTALRYIQKGARFTSPFPPATDIKLTETYNYIEAPLFAKFRVHTSQLGFYAFLGPSLSYNLNHSETPKTTTVNSLQSIDLYVANTEVSLNAGAGIDLQINQNKLFIEIQYQHSLNDIGRTNNYLGFYQQIYPNGHLRNRGTSITCGYAFSFIQRRPTLLMTHVTQKVAPIKYITCIFGA